ncbi:putative integral membrane protein [Mytilinidion resinicola]|uniref:Integral membrane protein n=1 Tax=Mytilinidion resinicola TaxID=574789 RepID=A0A6A6YQU4_9PEZI|nr:putative integral membrane protein [Mytilinidion resinicola]KAF2810903.1 putative integral membrane protein [Mytilinidion resinicola]
MPPALATISASPTPTFIPALRPPPGVTSNPEHPASLAHYSHLTTAICVPIITIFFLLRTYVRIFVKRVWIFEDVLTTAAWAGTIAYFGILEATMTHHGGEHGWDITSGEAHSAAYWFNVAAIEYGVMICVVKLAVLWLYRRVFSPKRWSPFDIAITVLIVILIGFYGITTFVKIFECNPRAKIADASIPGHCVDLAAVLKTSGSFNFITDFLILFLPVHAVWKLEMGRRKKALVVFVFTFGLCAPIFATIGFVVRLHNSANPDTSWRQPEILLWGAAELSSGNLCVCFPELGPLLPRILRLFPHRRRVQPSAQGKATSRPGARIPMLLKRARPGGRRARNVMDSGIGLSAPNGGGKSFREQFLPRGWMDSGLGSHNAGTVAAAGEGVEGETKAGGGGVVEKGSKSEGSDLEAP